MSAVVCTLNSIDSIEECLISLRNEGVGELIVVDGGSVDGTREIAASIADQVLSDPGLGLGHARNVGIAHARLPLILNFGSDNVIPPGELRVMIAALRQPGVVGVSARTVIEGRDWASRGLNAWRRGRFRPGPVAVIGTPTLMDGNLLRESPYDPARAFSDDSELCERWSAKYGARFLISDARVLEVGKTTFREVRIRCRMYGISDHEVYVAGIRSGWGLKRRLRSLTHPARHDFIEPLRYAPRREWMSAGTFLATFASIRYLNWLREAYRCQGLRSSTHSEESR